MAIDINWEFVKQEAYTTIRSDFTIETLIRLEADDNYTPVSGDALAMKNRAQRGL